jgi:hypothetical protein
VLVSQILKNKGDRVLSASPDESVCDAAKRLEAERVGALLGHGRRDGGRDPLRTRHRREIALTGPRRWTGPCANA